MDEKTKKKWVKALRSGKYAQTPEALWSDVRFAEDQTYSNVEEGMGYCCLGVLCDIMGYEPTDEGGYYLPVTADMFEDGEPDLSETLGGVLEVRDGQFVVAISGEFPSFAKSKFGFDKKVKIQGVTKDLQWKLIDMNDEGTTFDKIANYIEKVNF